MTDLTASDLKEISNKINDGIYDFTYNLHQQDPRTHLGISEIGKPCSRQLYYKFHWVKFEDFDARMLRLFNRGHREEERFISYLEGIGCKVNRFDENGKQFRVSGVLGHYGGSCDGQVITPWIPDKFILEMKTHNAKSFVKLVAEGLHKAKPEHLDQMNGYGFEMNIHYGLYFPENKNDDDIKVQAVKLDHNRGRALRVKAEEIILAQEPPARISDNPAHFDCKYCFARNICHYDEPPIKNCRSCRLSKPINDAKWFCTRWNDVIPPAHIKNGCPGWTPI